MIKFNDVLNQNLQSDPQFRTEYERLAPFYELKSALIKARIDSGLSTSDLAKRMNISKKELDRFLSCDEKHLRLSTLEKYLFACGKSYEFKIIDKKIS